MELDVDQSLISNDTAPLGVDAHAYWVAGRSSHPYDQAPGFQDAFLYTPVFAQLMRPVRHVHVSDRPLVFIPLGLAGEPCAPLAAMVGDHSLRDDAIDRPEGVALSFCTGREDVARLDAEVRGNAVWWGLAVWPMGSAAP